MNDNITYIKNILFTAKNYNEKEIFIKENTKAIAVHAFDSSIIEQVHFNKELEIIKNAAFINSNLKSLILEDDVMLEDYAFKDNINLEKIDIKSSQISFACFYNCGTNTDGLEIILKNTGNIGESAFENCKIKKLILPNTLQKIDPYAFSNAKFQQKMLIIPENVKEIGIEVFTGTNLTDVFLPNALKFFESTNCKNNKNINFHMSQKTFENLHIEKEPNIIIEKSLEELLKSASFKEVNKIVKERQKFYEAI